MFHLPLASLSVTIFSENFDTLSLAFFFFADTILQRATAAARYVTPAHSNAFIKKSAKRAENSTKHSYTFI